MTKQLNKTDLNSHIPGGIYLCQVNDHVSCAACCGLYNMTETSKQTLSQILLERTEEFAQTSRVLDAILAFGQESHEKIAGKKLYPTFHHCPYVGLIGESYSRVGCLLHPLSTGNNGIDYRGLSFYGGMACNMYFCPSHGSLTPLIKKIVRNAADDWYAYGLMITEITLLQSLFEEIQLKIRQPLICYDLMNKDGFLKIFREFMALKIIWPFRPPSHPSPCNYFFNDRQFVKPEIDYPNTSAQIPRFHRLFRELISRFHTQRDLHQAESLIDNLIQKMVSNIP